uniref:Uncharacterized protein n=1 Tax=Magallana gigas TaxID=29159 RepID=K1Q7J5_MAGGI
MFNITNPQFFVKYVIPTLYPNGTCDSDADCHSLVIENLFCCIGTEWCCHYGYDCTGTSTCKGIRTFRNKACKRQDVNQEKKKDTDTISTPGIYDTTEENAGYQELGAITTRRRAQILSRSSDNKLFVQKGQ